MFDLIRSIFSYSIQPRLWMICVLWTFCQDMMAELQWDLTTLKTEAAHGSQQAAMTFTFSNPTAASIDIESFEIHCGCVKVRHPELPWTIPPGTMHSLPVDLNIRGKKGLFHQDFVVMTSAGKVALIVEVDIEDPVRRPMSQEERLHNKQSSMEDARAIFKGECASCHALPTKGQYGPTLYDAACGICHDSSKRDPAVPDLKDKIKKESREYWHQWIVNGKKGSLMPGFEKSQGGPLSGSQISTLLHYLSASSSVKVP